MRFRRGLRRGIAVSFRLLAVVSFIIWFAPLADWAQVPASQTSLVSASASNATAKTQMPDIGNQVFVHALFNQLEGRANGSGSGFRWDGEGWIGTDTNRAWFKSEGFAANGMVSGGDIEAFYDRPLPRFRYFDGQVGIREDIDSGLHRAWLALGIEGLAPGFFQFEPTVYFRGGGHVAGRLATSYDLLITQRLIAEPELEMDFYSKTDPRRRLGTGLSDIDTGVRVRYEITRKFAPYAGFAYTREFGGTATFLRQAGGRTENPSFVFGLRVWY